MIYHFQSNCPDRAKKKLPEGKLFKWCLRRDSNPHALALDPKSSVSTNSTTEAKIESECIYKGLNGKRQEFS